MKPTQGAKVLVFVGMLAGALGLALFAQTDEQSVYEQGLRAALAEA